ncbi:hypothetical protein WNY37_04060 [Henriciella sp. AS95]|uniref:hypothetical protein n=1 Tax=Henriciella sp. AS95 TaxID=3135782 RepID=UPI003179C086
MSMPSRLAIAALSLSAVAACEPAANDYDTFIDKCLPVAQMQEQPGTSTNLMSAQNAAAACDCAWDRYNHDGGSASSGAIRSMVSSCLAEMAVQG